MENFLKKFNLHNLSKKQWVFFAGFFVTGIIFWLYLFMIFSLHSSIILGGIIGIFWFCFAGIGMLFLDNRLLFIAYGILSILVLILFGFRSFNIIGIIIFLVSTLWAHNRAERMRNSLLVFREVYITRKFFPIFLTGLALLIGFIWQSFIVHGKLSEPPQISEEVFHIVFVPIDNLVISMLPGYKPGSTIGELQDGLSAGFLSNILPSGTEDINNFFGSGANPQTDAQRKFLSMTLENFARIWFNTTIKNTLEPYLGLAPVFIVLGLFLVIKFAFWYLKWIVLALLFIVVKLMKMYNVLVIKEEQRLVNTPVL